MISKHARHLSLSNIATESAKLHIVPYRAAELHDEALFKEHPPRDECPICFLTLPHESETAFKSCCGKIICNGCIVVMDEESHGRGKYTVFVHSAGSTSCEGEIKRIKKNLLRLIMRMHSIILHPAMEMETLACHKIGRRLMNYISEHRRAWMCRGILQLR